MIKALGHNIAARTGTMLVVTLASPLLARYLYDGIEAGVVRVSTAKLNAFSDVAQYARAKDHLFTQQRKCTH